MDELSEAGSAPGSPVRPTLETPSPSTPLSPLVGLDEDGFDYEEQQANISNTHSVPDSPTQPEALQQPEPPQQQQQQHQEDPIALAAGEDLHVTARGTDVNIREAAASFRNFLQTFKSLAISQRANGHSDDTDNDDDDSMDHTSTDNDNDESQIEPFYISKLKSILFGQTNQKNLDIDTMHLYYHNEESQRLYHQLVHYPMELIPLMDLVVDREGRQILDIPDHDEHVSVQVRPFNLKQISNLRCLDPIAMDSLVCLKGMIVRSSPIIPDLKVAFFACAICGNTLQVAVDRGRVDEPHQCQSCNTKNTYQLIHNRSLFSDKQLVRLQETPDQVPAGQTPASVVTFCFDNLVDTCQPGDKVEVTGVLRAQPVRVNPKVSKLKTIYKTYIDVIHFRSMNGMGRDSKSNSNANSNANANANSNNGNTNIHATNSDSVLPEDRVRELEELAKHPDIYERLTQSLAPSIWELEDVKKGVLCMLFGGKTPQETEEEEEETDTDNDVDEEQEGVEQTPPKKKLHKRGDINILLCGDPGTSKSQLLSYVHKLSSRGVYTSGKGSSAVGLTASVVRDPETRDLVLESGALVLSDRGICCIDEFDKMTDATRSILHEAMEQQTVSIAKAGIIASLNARTSILASANPVESRYNPSLSVVENVKLPPTLLSRFDLIYLILDSPQADRDRRLAQHLVGLYYDSPAVVEPPMSTGLLRDYIDHARASIHPKLSDEAARQLLESYLELRNPRGGYGNDGKRTISATPRQLQSLMRTSEALAKMRYSQTVSREDALEAVRLFKVATQAAATDPRTGKIDMDMISTGRSTAERENGETLYEQMKQVLLENRGNRIGFNDLTKQLHEILTDSFSGEEFTGALKSLASDGIVQLNERKQMIFVRSNFGV